MISTGDPSFTCSCYNINFINRLFYQTIFQNTRSLECRSSLIHFIIVMVDFKLMHVVIWHGYGYLKLMHVVIWHGYGYLKLMHVVVWHGYGYLTLMHVVIWHGYVYLKLMHVVVWHGYGYLKLMHVVVWHGYGYLKLMHVVLWHVHGYLIVSKRYMLKILRQLIVFVNFYLNFLQFNNIVRPYQFLFAFAGLYLLKVSDIIQLQLLKFYYKYKNRTLPYFLAQLPFITEADIHDHLTRAQNQLRTNKLNHEHARYSIRYQIPKVINSTPIEILTKINTHSLQGFSRYIKHTIIQSYQELYTIQHCYICSRL